VSEVDFEDPPESWAGRAYMAGRLVYSVGARRRIGRVLDDLRPDVVHAHNIYHQLSPSVLAPADREGRAVLMTLHDYKLACPAYRFLNSEGICEACTGGRWYEATRRRCTRGMLAPSALNTLEAYLHHGLRLYERHVDLFVCPSEFLARKVAAAGIPERKLRVLRNFCDVDRTSPRFGGEDVVYAGRLSEEKGVATLLHSMASVPSARLHVFGTGPAEAALRTLAAERLGTRAVFHGRQDAAAVAEAMAAAACVVVPSEWYENCPMVVLEAFAAGTAVVATDLGGLPELITGGVDGLLVPPGDPASLADAITQIAEDSAFAEQLGRNARKRAERDFRLDGHVDAIRNLYAEARRA
jgi:glycosyltransferase involved in cell wall biosynthesis